MPLSLPKQFVHLFVNPMNGMQNSHSIYQINLSTVFFVLKWELFHLSAAVYGFITGVSKYAFKEYPESPSKIRTIVFTVFELYAQSAFLKDPRVMNRTRPPCHEVCEFQFGATYGLYILK